MNAEEDGDTATGFTLSRVLSGTPAEVFAHFTEPALFSRWFVVEGYTTPASRISLDPTPEGTISAVMLPDDGGPEIPFTAKYGIGDRRRITPERVRSCCGCRRLSRCRRGQDGWS
jgi:hypothetical protein